jgi:uncharacterized membrane protein
MTMQTLSVRDSISFGWRTFKARPWLFIGVTLLLLAIALVINMVEELVVQGADLAFGPQAVMAGIMAFIASAASVAASMLLELGRTVFFLRSHDRVESVTVRDLWHPAHFWSYLGTTLLFSVVVLVGFILLIVPGIILGIMFGFAAYIVADKGLKPIEAFKESARLTEGNRWNLFRLGLALLGINILGALALLVGLFVSLPISVLAMVHAYRTLDGKVMASEQAPVEVPAIS